MVSKVQIKRTSTPNSPPASLEPGELSVEMATPTRLWVGVPVGIDPTGKKLLLDTAGYVAKTGDIMSGALYIASPTYSVLGLQAPLGTGADIYGSVAGSNRWLLRLGAGEPETGANAGSNFSLNAYADDGLTNLNTPIYINRADGRITLAADPALPMQAATKQYVDTTMATGGGNYLPLAGGTVTGNLGVNGSMSCNTTLGVVGGSSLGGAVDTWSTVHMHGVLTCDGFGQFNAGQVDIKSADGVAAQLSLSAAGFTGGMLQLNTTSGESVDIYSRGQIAIRCAAYPFLLDQAHVICRQNNVSGNCALYLDDAGYNTRAQFAWNQASTQLIINTSGTTIVLSTATANLVIAENPYVYFYNLNNRITNANDLLIAGPAYKPGGGDWADSSDARIKTVKGDYTQGLAAIKQLAPKRYEFKGNLTGMGLAHEDVEARTTKGEMIPAVHESVLGKEFIGLVAQEAEGPMPELISQALGIVDGTPVADLRILDPSALTYALINAVKELAAKVEALEAAAAPASARR